jgi:hypothetical protein
MSINFKSYTAIVCMVFCLSETSAAASTAKYAGEFMAIGIGGRALGLGSAYIALADDITAGYWNPAGLSSLMYPQIALMHDERFAGLVNYDYGAVALPVGISSSVALSIIRLGVDGIPDTRNAWTDANGDGIPDENEIDPDKIKYFNDADWAVYVSYAKKVRDNFSYGVNLKIIRRDMEVAAATGIGFDIGVRYNPYERLMLGATVQDITTTLVAWNNGTNELITPTLKLGSAYALDALSGRFTPAFDIDVRFENRRTASNAHLGSMSFDFHGGLEYEYKSVVALRAGYNELGSLNVGAGVKLPKFAIDYSFSKFDAADQIGNTHRISLIFTLEADRFKRMVE